MARKLAYSESAARIMRRLRKKNPVIHERIVKAVKDLARARSPAEVTNVRRLRGRPLWRLRIGSWRVIFDDDGVILTVLDVGHRREIYR